MMCHYPMCWEYNDEQSQTLTPLLQSSHRCHPASTLEQTLRKFIPTGAFALMETLCAAHTGSICCSKAQSIVSRTHDYILVCSVPQTI